MHEAYFVEALFAVEATSENQSTWWKGRAERRLSAEGAPRSGISWALCYSVLDWFYAADNKRIRAQYSHKHLGGGKFTYIYSGGQKVRFKSSSISQTRLKTPAHAGTSMSPRCPIPPLLGTASTKPRTDTPQTPGLWALAANSNDNRNNHRNASWNHRMLRV